MKEQIKKEVLEEIHNISKIDTTVKYEDCIEKATSLAIQKTIEKIKKDSIGQMLQQMQGFKIGKWDDIVALAVSSGLSKKEWEYIKENEESGYLDEKDIKELDEYFNLEEKVEK